jgi:AcrR family transcriptional regulator
MPWRPRYEGSVHARPFVALNVTEQTFNILNVSSTPRDDRTAKARIRDAAISCIARYGTAGATVRKIASVADVSPGLVIHHFGSMEGLRSACDAFVASAIREAKLEYAESGPTFDLLAAFRNAKSGTLTGYLAAVIAEDSPIVANLVDDLIDDAQTYLERFEEVGWVRPSEAPRARAAVLMIWSLGALVLHRHVERLLDVDLTSPNLDEDPTPLAAYATPVFEILGGILTESSAQQLRTAFAALAKNRENLQRQREGS